MEKRGKYSSRKQNFILIFLVLLIVGSVGIYAFISYDQLEKLACYTVEQNTKEISSELNSSIYEVFSSIKLSAHLMTQAMVGADMEDTIETLGKLQEQTTFESMEYIDLEGKSITSHGEWYDASEQEYYTQGIQENMGISIRYDSRYSGGCLLYFYEPVYDERELIGVLIGATGAEGRLQALLDESFLGQKIMGILCDEDGRVLVSNLNTKGENNLEQMLDSLGMGEADIEQFMQYMKTEGGRQFTCESSLGADIVRIENNPLTEWRIIQIIPAESVRYITQKSLWIEGLLAVVICLLLLWYLVDLRMSTDRQHQMLVEDKNRVMQDYGQILTATASDTYKGIRRLDLDTAVSDYIFFSDNRVHQTRIGNWADWLENQKKNIHPEDYERVKHFLCLDHLRTLQEGVTYQESYRSALKGENGYYRTYTTTVSIQTMGGKQTAVMTTMDNTAAVLNEMRQKRWLQSAASIYVSMHAIDLKKDTLETLNSAEHIRKILGEQTQNASKVLPQAMQKLTDEQYLEQLVEFIDFTTLDERMQGVNTITMEFLGKVSGWCRARFIAVEYDEKKILSQVLYVVENINAEKQRANRLLYLSETDLMTGICNRGSGERKIRKLLEDGHEGLFCLLDVDNFKLINDNYGHGVGDKVLIAIATCMKEVFDETDVVMRLGGDEFAIFADGICDEEEGLLMIQQLFEKLDDIDVLELEGREISVSLGAAIRLEKDGWDFEMLYHNADSCTYQSKKKSGNACAFYEQR